MQVKRLGVLIALAVLAWSAGAENITGTILIKKRLTRRSVTATVPVYQRGAIVQLGKDTEQQDPLAFERSRVIVYLEGPAPQDEPGQRITARIAQIDRRFSPDLVVIPAGSAVVFPNEDPIFHNIFSLSKPISFDLGSYDKGESRTVQFPRAGVVDVYCHLHPNMTATVVVTPNRWYARSDPSGQYRIPDVPPGRYTVVAWHKYAGLFRKSIVVEPGHDATVDFFIPLEADHGQEESSGKDDASSVGTSQ